MTRLKSTDPIWSSTTSLPTPGRVMETSAKPSPFYRYEHLNNENNLISNCFSNLFIKCFLFFSSSPCIPAFTTPTSAHKNDFAGQGNDLNTSIFMNFSVNDFIVLFIYFKSLGICKSFSIKFIKIKFYWKYCGVIYNLST